MNIEVLNKYSTNVEILIKIKLFIITITLFTIINIINIVLLNHLYVFIYYI